MIAADPIIASVTPRKHRGRGAGVQQLPSGRFRGLYRDASGKRCSTPTFDTSREAADALKLARAKAVQDRKAGRTAAREPLTVDRYIDRWIKGREGRVRSVKDEASKLRLHARDVAVDGHRFGSMKLSHVRPRHVRELVERLRARSGDDLLAPRTIRHVFAVLHRLFRSAVIDELIDSNPVIVDRGVLPKNEDRDPEWRGGAVYTRAELETLVSDAAIPARRRVLYALKGIAALRHGEAAGLRWRHYQPDLEPLGKLTVANSYGRSGTKTGVTREVPVHPVLAAILAEWKLGWCREYGRQPKAEDFIIPTENQTPMDASNSQEYLHGDLARLGLRLRRGHDLRRTLITLARADGARADILQLVTHGPGKSMIEQYSTMPWASLCEAVACLKISRRPHGGEVAALRAV